MIWYIFLIYIVSSYGAEFGYLFNGFDDHLSFSVVGGHEEFPSLSIQFWFKNEQKEKFGNLEQCIVSHGSWEERFKVSWTGLSTLMITLRNSKDEVVDCHTKIIPKLSHSRWYNFAFTYDSTFMSDGVLHAFINGLEVGLSCTKDDHTVFMGPWDNQKPFNGPLHGTSSSFTVGGCHEGDNGFEKWLFHGYVTGLQVYRSALSLDQVWDSLLNWDPRDASHPTPLASQPLLLKADGSPVDVDLTRAHSEGVSLFHVHGSPLVKELNLGDMQLSLQLTVAQAKLFMIEAESAVYPSHGNYTSLSQEGRAISSRSCAT